MRNRFFIVLLIFLSLLSCKKNTDKQDIESNSLNNESENYTIIERYFPETKQEERFDTLAQSIQVSIITKLLDTYAINEHENPEDKIKYIDKYRDGQIELKITQDSEIIIDTIFVKESFLDYIDQSFLDITNLHYSFYEVKNDTAIFYGSIIKPETDWDFSFKHNLSLKTKKFSVQEEIEE